MQLYKNDLSEDKVYLLVLILRFQSKAVTVESAFKNKHIICIFIRKYKMYFLTTNIFFHFDSEVLFHDFDSRSKQTNHLTLNIA